MNLKDIVVPKSVFPVIENISDLLPYIQDKKEIAVSNRSNGTTVVCYNVEDGDTFSNDYARECRGLVFDTATGNIIGRPLHKFFNLGENDKVQISDLDWTRVVAVWDKLDGSMVTAHRVNGVVDFKTKKSFDSDVVLAAKAFISDKAQNVYDFCDEIVDEFTPIFEYTSPERRIVIGFDEDKLTLLHVRHIKTGAYIPLTDPALRELIEKHNVDVLSPVNLKKDDNGALDVQDLLGFLKTAQQIEGYVIQFEHDMVKVKCDWYRNAHKVVSFLRERDVVRMVLEASIDDAKAFIAEVGYSIKPIEDLEHRVVSEINAIAHEVEDVKALSVSKNMSVKDIAIAYKDHPYRSLIMNAVRGVENDYVDYYKKHFLKNFSLNEVKIDRISGNSVFILRDSETN